jgi:hypothetical protein
MRAFRLIDAWGRRCRTKENGTSSIVQKVPP